jgi:hypothetical protein
MTRLFFKKKKLTRKSETKCPFVIHWFCKTYENWRRDADERERERERSVEGEMQMRGKEPERDTERGTERKRERDETRRESWESGRRPYEVWTLWLWTPREPRPNLPVDQRRRSRRWFLAIWSDFRRLGRKLPLWWFPMGFTFSETLKGNFL